MVMSTKTGIVQLKISRNQGGDISGHMHMPSPFWASKKFALDWKCSENGKNDTKSKKKKKKVFMEKHDF